jgi:hypothetical protein
MALSGIRKDSWGGSALCGSWASTGGMTDPAAVLGPSAGSADEVFLWRLEQFRELGLSEQEAAELAASDADIGQARYVLGNGCAPELALAILR